MPSPIRKRSPIGKTVFTSPKVILVVGIVFTVAVLAIAAVRITHSQTPQVTLINYSELY